RFASTLLPEIARDIALTSSMEAADEVGEDQYWIGTGEGSVPNDVTHVRVSDGVTRLRESTFIDRERLVAVELNEGLVEIGSTAFYSCTSLECVRIPSSVTTVGASAFAECIKLGHVEFPEDSRVDTIMNCAFEECTSLTEIKLPKYLSTLGEHSFSLCSRLMSVDLATTGLVAIEKHSFDGCTLLADVRLPATIRRLGNHAFRYCTSLSNIILHEGTKTIDAMAFSGCESLSIDKLPSTVETIGHGAFSRCSLRHFASPLHCKELKLSALDCCEKLKSIQIVGDDTMLVNGSNNYCFRNQSLLRMNIPQSYRQLYHKCNNGMFSQGSFLSNICIAPNSTIHKGAYEHMFHEFIKKGCTLDMIRSRFKQLPLHEICFDYSNQHTEVTFEQVKDCLKKNTDAVREKDCIGMTPLHIIACSTNHDVRLFQILISSSHNTLMDQDIFGRTALDYALLSDAPEEVSFRTKGPPESEYAHQTYRWFAGKAAKQRMIKMSTLTVTRQLKVDEMICGFQSIGNFKSLSSSWSSESSSSSDDDSWESEVQWRRQVGPVWKLMKRWELKEATILLELALWKCCLNDSSVGSGSRVAARVGCGAEVIINEVVQYLSHDDFETDIFGGIFSLGREEYRNEDEDSGSIFASWRL
ncbi:hypothetical protein THAOC_00430, partial [Thalassiosira oceanica]